MDQLAGQIVPETSKPHGRYPHFNCAADLADLVDVTFYLVNAGPVQ